MTLERIEHKVFASEAPLDEMGQFGSALATTKLNTKDVAEIQALPAYTKGWGSAIISENNYPAMEEMNGVLNVMSYHTGYLYQEGIPIYSATQEYSVTSWVKDLAGEKIYKSLQGGNKGHDLTDSAWWEELKLGGGGLEIGDIGIAPLGIDETKGKRRYLNGQLIIQEQYVQFTNKVKSAIALYPSLACTESEWQTTATMTVGGQVGKFVVDNDAGTIRLPKIIMPIQGLTDLSKLGEIVEAGLPNITGNQLTGVSSGNNYVANVGGGAFKNNTSYYNASGAYGAESGQVRNWFTQLNFDASNSNPIYSKSDTVQQEQIQYPYFIQVATGAETKEDFENEQVLNNPFFIGYSQYFENAPYNLSWSVGGSTLTRAVHPDYYDSLLIELNADIEVGTTQNNYTKRGLPVKLATDSDITDYDFVVNTADETFTLPLLNGSEDLPSVHIKSYTVTASGNTYTAPSNGWFVARVTASKDTTSTFARLTNKNQNKYVSNSVTYGSTNYHTYANLFCKKGDEVVMEYGANSTNPELNFTYAQGNGSLYFYVGEVAQNTNLVNAGRIEEIKANRSELDGQWVYKYMYLIDGNTSFTTGQERKFDLSDYLPNDGCLYEVILTASIVTGATSGNHLNLLTYTDFIPTATNVCRVVTRTNSAMYASGAVTTIVGSGRWLSLTASAGSSGTNYADSAQIKAYRKVR